MRVFGLLLCVTLLAGCDGSSEHQPIEDKEAFRQSLLEKALNDDTRRAGNEFLANNLKQPGVQVTASGLQYRIITDAAGAKPARDQIVEVQYQGRRVDGGIFDATAEGKSIKFPLNQVIDGWREGLSMMSVGSEWELFIPADLAYGARSPSVDIPANSTLIFTVKLLGISDAGAQE